MRVLVKAVELLASGRAQATVTFVSWFGLSKKDLIVKQQSSCKRWVRATGEPFGSYIHDLIDSAIDRYMEYYDVKRPEVDIEDLTNDLPKKIKRVRYNLSVHLNDGTEYSVKLPDVEAYDYEKAKAYVEVKVRKEKDPDVMYSDGEEILKTITFVGLTVDASLFKSVHVSETTELVPVVE